MAGLTIYVISGNGRVMCMMGQIRQSRPDGYNGRLEDTTMDDIGHGVWQKRSGQSGPICLTDRPLLMFCARRRQ